MKSAFLRTTACGLAAALLVWAGPRWAGAQQGIGVTVNGNPVNLAPPPIERAGRVFVPLRGVFERLGASVVYQNGLINATGQGGRDISLHVGSTQATIDGHPRGLDVAPFIVGASTYVPLRFVAEALGAEVNWDPSNDVVAITTSVAEAPPPRNVPPPPVEHHDLAAQTSAIALGGLQPSDGATVASNRPTIEARFRNGYANPNSIEVFLDHLNITDTTSRSPNGIVYSPPSDLLPQRHDVEIRGSDANGEPFDLHWTFTSGTRVAHNFLAVVTPPSGAHVGSTFMVRGKTAPGARVTIEAGGAAHVGGFMIVGTGTFRGDVVADAGGNFADDVSLGTVPGGTINLVVTSTDPSSQATAPQIRRQLIER